MNDKTTPQASTDAQALDALTDTKLDTVRDILFGAQVRETNQKNEQLEQLIQTTADKLQKDFDKQIQGVNTALSALKTSLAKQADATAADVAKRFNEAAADLDTLEKTTQTKHSDLFDELTAEREALEQRATSWNEDLAKQLEQVHQQLLYSKTDRSTLASLLSNMAESLAPENSDQT